MKKWSLIVGLVIAAVVAWYLISPVFRVVEVHEESPLIKDAMETMDAATKVEFEKAVEAARENVMVMTDTMPVPARVVVQGLFKPSAHDVMGRALLIEVDDKKILRFEDFETINGPDLHVFLATELGIAGAVDLGEIKATKGSVNYELDPSIDTTKYNKVLVWCVPFRVLFSYAVLQ
ncbi:MAG: DM13 domain-containing protein [Candidatus Hydrothermarchaeota archaeon]